MKWKVAGALMCMISLFGCNNDIEKPAPERRAEVETSRGKVIVQNAVKDADNRFVTAEIVGDGIEYTLQISSTKDEGAVTGGLAELRDETGQLLFSFETMVNNDTGEVMYTQATPEDYLTQTIVTDDERVWEYYDASGDVASFEYPSLPADTQRRAANYFKHGLPAANLPAGVREYVTTLGEFDAYYKPHSTSTLHNNPAGELLAEILSSQDLKGLVGTEGGPESERWDWVNATCTAARACQTLICYTNPGSLVCFACTAVTVACAILDIICDWFGC